MKEHLPSDLQRLLEDYERLTRDEMVALYGQDFSSLDRIHGIKPGLLGRMIEVGQAAGLDRGDEEFRDRLDALSLLEEQNETVAAGILVQTKEQLEQYECARSRLRGLGLAYRPGQKHGARFNAHG